MDVITDDAHLHHVCPVSLGLNPKEPVQKRG